MNRKPTYGWLYLLILLCLLFSGVMAYRLWLKLDAQQESAQAYQALSGAAVHAGHSVTVLEHMDAPGKKLLITGKGRCNVTNNCTPDEFLKNVRRNPRFLYSAKMPLRCASSSTRSPSMTSNTMRSVGKLNISAASSVAGMP